MLTLLTSGSKMRQLYLQYLKQRKANGEDNQSVSAVLASIKAMIIEKDSDGKAFSAFMQKKRFQQYQRNLNSLGDSVDPAS